mgnify:CR=1 FL=1
MADLSGKRSGSVEVAKRGRFRRERPRSKGRRPGWKNGLSIGLVGLLIALVFSGPLGNLLQGVDVATGVLLLVVTIGIAILADILAVAATAGEEAPFNAMASKRIPGAKEALLIVRNAGRVNSICGDVIGDIAGTLTGLVAAPLILALDQAYPALPPSVISMGVIGAIAFVTIGGKAAEKEWAVRASTSVILTAGKAIYYVKRAGTSLTRLAGGRAAPAQRKR